MGRRSVLGVRVWYVRNQPIGCSISYRVFKNATGLATVHSENNPFGPEFELRGESNSLFGLRAACTGGAWSGCRVGDEPNRSEGENVPRETGGVEEHR